jgi:hypothetical protein
MQWGTISLLGIGTLGLIFALVGGGIFVQQFFTFLDTYHVERRPLPAENAAQQQDITVPPQGASQLTREEHMTPPPRVAEVQQPEVQHSASEPTVFLGRQAVVQQPATEAVQAEVEALSHLETAEDTDRGVDFTTLAEARELVEQRTELDEETRALLLYEYQQALQEAEVTQDHDVSATEAAEAAQAEVEALSHLETAEDTDRRVDFTTLAEARELVEQRTDLDEETQALLLYEYQQALQEAEKTPAR